MQLNGFHSILTIQNGILFDIRIGRFSPLTDPNPKYLHNSIAPIRIFEHWSGANKYVEIEGSDPLYYTAFY